MLKTQSNNIDSTESNTEQNRPPTTNFFVSFWTRIKFFFTTALAEVCNCTIASKNHLSQNDSFSTKGDEDCFEDASIQTFKTPPTTLPTDQEPAGVALLCAVTEESDGNFLAESSDASHRSQEVTTTILLRESPHKLIKKCDSVDEYVVVAEEHLESIDLAHEDQFSTAIIFAHPTMMASVAPQTYFSKLLQVAEKTQVFEIPLTNDEEVVFEDNFLAESLCSSTESYSDSERFQPLTTLGRLHTKLINGDLTRENYQEMAASVIASTIPRNLSDSDETRKSRGANQLYAWQVPPPLPTTCPVGDSVDFTVQQVANDEGDSGIFVGSLISNTVERIVNDSRNNGSCVESLLDDTSRSDDAFTVTFPKYSCIEFDTASLERVRSSTISGSRGGVRSKRSSSLKSERSPDEIPCRKIVRFADSLGLDLATVRQVKDADNPPNIPASATLDLNLDTEKTFSSLGAKQYQMCFPQPGASAGFMHRVLSSFVCLENARVESSRGVLTGTIRVKSVGFEKKVAVRITYNNWSTFFEIPASYVQDSHDGITDRFSFSAVFPSSMVANDRAQFAVRYETHTGVVYWDNNHGENYAVICHSKATDMAGDGSWIHYL